MSSKNRVSFIVNSANRLSGTPYNFQVKLNIDNNQKYDRVSLLSAVVAKTYYQVQAGSNTFQLSENETATLIVISVGTYSRDSFANVLAGLLTANSANEWIYTITYPNLRTAAETGLFTYSVTGNNGSQSQFIMGSDNIHNQLGFQPNTTYSFVGNSLKSNHVCNFSSEPCIYIKSDICYNAVSSDNILQEIYTAGFSYNSFISYTNFNPEFNYKTLVNHNGLYNFYITDSNGVFLDTNGIDSTFTIMIWKSNKIDGLIEHYIKWSVNKKDKLLVDEEND